MACVKISNAQAFFEAIAARARDARLNDTVGSWEFEIEGVGFWTVMVDHGGLHVNQTNTQAKEDERPKARFVMNEDELLRLVRGDGHHNLFTAMIRGTLEIHGELAFAQKLQTLLPIPDEWGIEK